MDHSPLLLQLVVILGTARLLGLVLRYFGQPAVIGEMAAGFVLGPVVFGALAPELHAHVFAAGQPRRAWRPVAARAGAVHVHRRRGAAPAGRRARKQIAAAGWIGVPVGARADGARPAVAVPAVSDDSRRPA